MSGLLCEHACAIVQSIGKNLVVFVDEWFTFPKQEIIYSDNFCGIQTHGIPTIGDDRLVRSLKGDIILDLTLHVLSDRLIDQGRIELNLNSKIRGLVTPKIIP